MKKAIITGGGTGLGKELGKLLSKDYHIVLLGRTKENLEEAAGEIRRAGGEVSYAVLDVRSPREIEQVCSTELLQDDLGLLIHNAGVGYFGPFANTGDDELEAMFETNVLGPIRITKALLSQLVEGGTTVINVISTAGLRGKKNESLYVASKFALRGFGESLQKEYEDSRLRVVNAYMGGMNTPFWDESDHISDRSRLRSPVEIAEIIVEKYKLNDEIIIESKK
ncbi:SDR family NAD(P)-dependent oxidoreductase [Rossellomorea aquimaris]|uniref:Short-chain dehydrogenase n=1 Tax=Rossellomorea aquimaris TaxID=189382 RepID=A0A1J6WKQ3_9BACI|nr:SDR family oxidoreductase [Rossellomorea aquimaris]OIU68819.1 short-chain dehydrogenase [Rossellomorea aquimaris]